MSISEPRSLSTPPLCATIDPAATTIESAANGNRAYGQHLVKTIPKATATPTITTALFRNQSVPLMKNGLPIKSALKSPVVSANLKCSTNVRPSSIRSNSSPTLATPKFVHFDTHLEHVRLFLQGEMPSCIAERETIIDNRQNNEPTSDIELTLTNWKPVANGAFQPVNIDTTGASPLRVEDMTLSENQSELEGTVLIQNIAFHKHVSVRYTVDFWQTQSEVNAEFVESIPGSALDRFGFKIVLDMEKAAVEKTFCFAVRYQVIGREFWDSNDEMNYRVECKRVVIAVASPSPSDLSKKMNNVLLGSRLPDYGKPVLKKKTGGRYDWSSSLSTTYSQPVSIPYRSLSPKPEGNHMNQTAYRPSEYIMPVQSPPGYHHSLYASSPKFMTSYLSAESPPDHFHIEFDKLSIDRSAVSKQGTRDTWAARETDSDGSSLVKSAPIAIPSVQDDQRPQVGSSSYVDLVDRYCFYEPSPRSSPYSSYSNSPSAPCIRG
ncbi:hypothetical protein BGZ65_005127 [Modicella reniformis]|uniref:CBM21 domain-containing protein n=1 Tax=Modicella reniformis TaxID=1440133 RepID=A0A9P6M8N0_9FUNG|nr:hypothetical protein BGZ65_005127 [Modicella reniformis]